MLEMTTHLANLKPNMLNYEAIVFPVYTVHTDNVEMADGILWVEDQVLDDRNMKGKTLGLRRLQSPMKSIYPLKYMVQDIPSLLMHKGKQYIDSEGHYFVKEKTTQVQLKYHKILRVERKEVVSILWCKDCVFPFTLKRPLDDNITWAGILYKQNIPWILYNVSSKKEKDTWRKI